MEISSWIKGFLLWVWFCSHFVRPGMWKLEILSKIIKGRDCYEIESREKPGRVRAMEALWYWRLRGLGGICVGPGSGARPAEALPGGDPPSTLRAALCWGGNARALGFLWPSFWLVFPHLIPAQHSEADQVQRGHDFSKVTPRVVAETGRVSELQTVSKGCFSHGKWSQGYREGNRRAREFRLGISKAIPGSCSNQFCLNIF